MLFFKTGPGVAPYVIHLPRVDTRRCGDMLLPRISQPAKYGRLWSRDLRRGFRDFHGGRQRSVSSWGRLLTAALPFLQTMLTLRRHESTMRLTPFLIALRFRISLEDFVTQVYRCRSTEVMRGHHRLNGDSTTIALSSTLWITLYEYRV